ncbi:carbohydrate ABC transporter permease [Spelaeicoccus albus]|uniref:Multiple sugar transport system permease protein n=1 Tax=Spelaeicoccus albus TaxID=1280376 RepID=A0A7Z0CZV7_9MICO|nr:carbohydrate ABC transporter permease [Spelaeicoccus albus]NYI66716.1 multiple sugar transport system permease protein [Spelaeicoccus albus]
MTAATKRRTKLAGTHAILIVLSIVMIYPVLWMLSSSFKPTSEIFSSPGLLPDHWTLENYVSGWQGVGGVSFGTFFLNSLIISVCVVIGSLFIASLTGFAFARLKFKLRGVMFAMMLATIMLPIQVTLIPQYVIFHKLGWVNTFLPLIVPSFVGVSITPFFIFLMVQFIRGLPKELDEAATIDGCSTFQLFWRIVLPLSKPAMITISIFAFYWTWDDFFSQLIYLSDPNKFTASTGLNLFLSNAGNSQWGALFAMSILSVIPVIVVFVIFQKHLVKGVSTTGMKL